ncbi:MAG: flagellin [Thermoplasmatota archaeon]
MRKIIKIKKDEIGAIGIGAMIILIAMILVAGVAASVLISTSNTLQIQAMSTGMQTTREVSTGIRVYAITGLVNKTGSDEDGWTYNNITCLAITVEGRAGSGRIDLNNSYILLSDGNTKALIRYGYNDSEFFHDSNPITGDIFDTAKVNWTNLSHDQFGIAILQDADGSITRYNPVLNRGDKAILYIFVNESAVFGQRIETRQEIFGHIIPEFGAPGVISFTSPKAYARDVYQLQ